MFMKNPNSRTINIQRFPIIFAIVAGNVAALHFTVAVAVASLQSSGCSGSGRGCYI